MLSPGVRAADGRAAKSIMAPVGADTMDATGPLAVRKERLPCSSALIACAPISCTCAGQVERVGRNATDMAWRLSRERGDAWAMDFFWSESVAR